MNIEKIMKKHGFASDAGLADYLGVSEATVKRWKNGAPMPGYAKILMKYIEMYGRM